MLTAEEIAKRYAGKVIVCHITKSPPIAAGDDVRNFKARIIGWKVSVKGEPAYVALEVLPPGQTKFLVKDFRAGYTFTHKADPGAYAKKVLPEEIEIPANMQRVIATWPHTCPACSSPAQILFHMIDCSNEKCKHKFKTNSGVDLFLPKDMRPELATPSPTVKKRDYVDAQGFVLCRCNKIATTVKKGTKGSTFVSCGNIKCATGRVINPQKGDKITMAGVVHEFDGKMTWVKK